MTNLNWYEKTVEYAFIRKFLDASAMPLSGAAEKIGDTIFHDDNGFYIVEFKRGKNEIQEIKNEQNKYSNYEESIKKLYQHPAKYSHYVVSGAIQKNVFILNCSLYFEFLSNFAFIDGYGTWQLTSLCVFLPKTTNEEKIIGINLSTLKDYLKLLITEKRSLYRNNSNIDYDNIIIIDKYGNACSLLECISELNLLDGSTSESTLNPENNANW